MIKKLSSREKVRHDLECLTADLIGLGLADDQNFPAAKQVGPDLWEVSFHGAEAIALAMGDIEYSDLYQELFANRSFSLKLIDGGLLQLSYRFDNDNLIKHRLAYYPSPNLRSFQEDPDVYLREELYVDIVSRRLVPFPIRFDYDLKAAKDVAHPSCHLTLGDVEGCRIPVHCPLTPRQFVEFVVRNFYQTDKYEFVSKLPSHKHFFDVSISANEKKLIHLVVPAVE